jgi:hypothetical protein
VRVDRPNREIGFHDYSHNRPVCSRDWTMREIAGTIDTDAAKSDPADTELLRELVVHHFRLSGQTFPSARRVLASSVISQVGRPALPPGRGSG